jgi:hypothetical protein
MSSASAGAIAMSGMALLSAIARWAVIQVPGKADAAEGLGPGWAHFFVRIEPWLAIVVVGVAALVGSGSAPRRSLVERRAGLGAWLLMAAVAGILALVGPRLAPTFPTALALACGFVAVVASVAESVALQRRLRPLGSPVDSRHVAAASVVLLILGPLALLPPFGVWVHSGRFVGEQPATPKAGRKRKK